MLKECLKNTGQLELDGAAKVNELTSDTAPKNASLEGRSGRTELSQREAVEVTYYAQADLEDDCLEYDLAESSV